MLAAPILMKIVLDSINAGIFGEHNQTIGGKIKGFIFYITVLGLSVMMLFKAITGILFLGFFLLIF